MKDVEVLGVRVEMPGNAPVVLLQEVGGPLCVPIWIGAAEAAAIAYAQQGVVPPRPLTHDLLTQVIGSLSHTVHEVRITALTDGVFFAELVLTPRGGGHPVVVESRSSDAIAIALRAGAPVRVADQIFASAGVPVPDGEESEGQEDELEKFREFLDQISPEDFEGEGPGPDPSA